MKFPKINFNRYGMAAILLVGAILLGSAPALAESPEGSPAVVTWSEDKRFLDNGDDTITDTQTGLMWMKKDSRQHFGHWLTWREAFTYVKKLNEEGFAGHYDWQMPTLDDLKTLFEANKTNSRQMGSGMTIHIDPIFEKEGSGAWWSLEPNGNFNAFGIEYNNGGRFSSAKTAKARRAVRAMRIVVKP